MEDMQGLLEYIEKYGSYSFDELALNEVDALIFSQLSYINFENVVDKRIYLNSAAVKYYTLYSNEQLEGLIGIVEKALQLLTACAKTHRFGYVELFNYQNHISDDIDKQFAGICFKISDDDLVVAFRGTDVTVTGVKESAMLSYMFPIPAQIEALHFFQESAMRFGGKIYACGHSKGGNLAVFAAVNCSNSLKKQIEAVYEFDAPGFPAWFFERYDYNQIDNKICRIAPVSSVIGRMLNHKATPIIVDSINSGLKQHQVSSWVVENGKLKQEKAFSAYSDFVEEYINQLIDFIGEDDLELFFDTIEYVAENMNINDFYDLKSIDIKMLFSLVDSFGKIDEVQSERFKYIMKKAVADFAKEFFTSKAKTYWGKLSKPKTE